MTTMEKDGLPRLNMISKYQPWIRAFKSFLASKDLAAVLLHNFCRPTPNHPSMEAFDPLIMAPLIPVGQAAVPMILAGANNPGVPAQPAGMTTVLFDAMLKEYYTFESKVYGYSISAIQNFTSLYDHIMALPDVEHMQETRLLGSVIFRHITAYCTNNNNDGIAGITTSKILMLSLEQFKSCADLVRELNELYHVLPPRLAHSDAQKKLQLKTACGKDYRLFFMAHNDGRTYNQLCTALVENEEEDAATAVLSGLKSERGVRKVKAAEESNAETAMAAVDDNTARNRSNLSVRFNPRGHNGKYNSRSRSNSNDRGNQRRSPSPAFRPRQRRRENSRSPSPYGRQERSQERSPGRDRRTVRYAEVNQQWRTVGSGYRDARTEGRYNEGIKCFSCGIMGHKSNVCPRNQSAAASPGLGSGGVTCYSCGRHGHKAYECPEDRRNR